MHPVAERLGQLRAQLNEFYLERDEFIHAALLAILAKQHFFALGPPGTSKSQLIRSIVAAINGARYFEAALSKTTPVEKVMGPLDLKRFRETGEYKLLRAGYASQVEYLMLDEVGKMSPVLGHDLLALANERIYHEVDGETSVHSAPLMTLFSASNEMLTNEDSAAAFWDRLLVRVVVDYLRDADNFATLLTGNTEPSITVSIDFDELRKVVEVDVPGIQLSRQAVDSLVRLRRKFEHEHLYPSDRRWKASVRILQANAFLNGRSEVEEGDLEVLRFTLWDTVETLQKVADLCLEASNPHMLELSKIRNGIAEIRQNLELVYQQAQKDAQVANMPLNQADLMRTGREFYQKFLRFSQELEILREESQRREIPGLSEVIRELRSAFIDNSMKMLGQERDEAEILADGKLIRVDQ